MPHVKGAGSVPVAIQAELSRTAKDDAFTPGQVKRRLDVGYHTHQDPDDGDVSRDVAI